MGSLSPCCYFENRIPLKLARGVVGGGEGRGAGGGGGAYAASQTTLLRTEETQSYRVSDFRDFVCSLFPKAILVIFILICAVNTV